MGYIPFREKGCGSQNPHRRIQHCRLEPSPVDHGFLERIHRAFCQPSIVYAKCKQAAHTLMFAGRRRCAIVPTVAELSQLSGTNLFEQEELPSFAPGNKSPLQQSLALSQRLGAYLSRLLVCKIVSNCSLCGDRLIRFRLGSTTRSISCAFNSAFSQLRVLAVARMNALPSRVP